MPDEVVGEVDVGEVLVTGEVLVDVGVDMGGVVFGDEIGSVVVGDADSRGVKGVLDGEGWV